MQESIPTKNDSDAKKKVFELIKDIKTAMLVTQAGHGQLSARPMAAAALKEFNGDVWFFTDIASPKVAEIEANPNILLSYSNPSKQDYVSLRGTATIERDRAKIHEFWNEMARIWFPEGKDDPKLCLIKVSVDTAEYWDSPSSVVVFLYGYAKTLATGTPPKHMGDAGKVDFQKTA